ncbi:MAG: hypothetical protein MUF27_17405 [Acidobacteria bacterium]|nr:hypothetical protein [Acidobacteriota bacterium]
MGVSRERVRQIETQAKQRLRRIFNRPRPSAAKTAKPNPAAKSKGSKRRS